MHEVCTYTKQGKYSASQIRNLNETDDSFVLFNCHDSSSDGLEGTQNSGRLLCGNYFYGGMGIFCGRRSRSVGACIGKHSGQRTYVFACVVCQRKLWRRRYEVYGSLRIVSGMEGDACFCGICGFCGGCVCGDLALQRV